MISIRKLGVIRRSYRHLNRYRDILSVLIRYGFDELIDILKLEQYFELGLQMLAPKIKPRAERFSRAERARMVLQELGPAFVKLGQILSTRPDLIPVEFVREFEKLQDSVPPFPYSQVAQLIVHELGKAPEEVFLQFEKTPFAGASIGQVHRAQLRSGEDAVVKVQRPGIRDIVNVDLEIMAHLASLIEHHVENVDAYKPTKIVSEFARSIAKEIDYTVEASHIERFAAQFKGEETIYVPKVFSDYTTGKILTMEYVDGIKASNLVSLEKAGLDRRLITERGINLALKQIFEYGFFHADPHPGNVYVLPGNIICFLDFGMMGQIDREIREDFAEWASGFAQQDEKKVVHALLKLTTHSEPPDQRSLRRDVAELLGQHAHRPLKEIRMDKLFQQVMEMLSHHHLQIPPDLFLMTRALTISEGLGLTLAPDFDMMEKTIPFLKRLQAARMHPKRIATDLYKTASVLAHLLQDVPTELRDVLIQLRQGRIKIQFEQRGLNPSLTKQDQMSNRIAISIVIAALIIGSALISMSKIPPLVFNIPVVGIAGFVIAAIFSSWLLLAILRKGRF